MSSVISLRSLLLGGSRKVTSRLIFFKNLDSSRNVNYHSSKCKKNYNEIHNIPVESRSYSSTSNFQSTLNQIQSNESNSHNQGNECYASLLDDIKSQHRVSYEAVRKTLTALEQHGVDSDQSEFLIKSCGNLMPDINVTIKLGLVKQIMTLLSKQSKLNIEHFHAMLDIYYENGVNVGVNEIVSKMESAGLTPVAKTYHKLLRCVSNCGDVTQGLAIISRMKELSYVMTEDMFNAMVLCYALNGEFINAETIMDTMLREYIPHTGNTFTALLEGMAVDNEYVYKIPEFLREKRKRGIVFNNEQKLRIIRRLALSDNHKYICHILMDDRQYFSSHLIERFCINLIHSGASKAAFEFYNEIYKNTPIVFHDDDQDIYAAVFIKEIVKVEPNPNTIIDICTNLMETERNKYALHVACETALKYGLPNGLPLVQALKHQGIPVRPHFLWPLLITASKKSGENGVFGILNSMRYLNAPADSETLEHYVLPRIKTSEPELAIRKLQDVGLKLPLILTPLITYLISQKNIIKAVEVIERYKETALNLEQMIKPLVICFANGSCSERVTRAILHLVNNVESFKKQNAKYSTRPSKVIDWAGQFIVELLNYTRNKFDTRRFEGLLKEYKVNELRISEFASDVIMEYFKSNLNGCPPNIEQLLKELTNASMSPPPTELSCQHIPHPRNMNLSQLEDHLIELKAKKMNTRGVLRRLLLLYCKNENLDRANEVLSECEKQGMILSPGMRSTIFEMHVKCQNIQKAMDTLDELRKDVPGFKIDEHKIIDFATLLFKNEDMGSAMNLLKNYNAYYDIIGGKGIEKNCWKFITAVSESENKLKTMDILQILVTLKFCQINNVMLGPVVRAYLNNNDLPGAVEAFINCANRHRCTPLQLELMTLLAKRDEQEYLKEVIEVAKKVHGQSSTFGSLIIALASADKERSLRKLLLDHSSEISPALLKSRCERLVTENALKPLEVLAKASRKISYLESVDIYYYILQIHHRKGNCEEALRLYESLVDDDIDISRNFKMTLINLLDSNGYSLPKGVAPNIHVKQRNTNLK